MRPYLATTMENYGHAHIHPGELVYMRRHEADKLLVLLSHTKSRQSTFATMGNWYVDTLEPYTDHIDNVLTPAEAADMLGVNKARISQLLDGGHLVGRKTGGSWIIDRRSVELRKAYQDAENAKHRKI